MQEEESKQKKMGYSPLRLLASPYLMTIKPSDAPQSHLEMCSLFMHKVLTVLGRKNSSPNYESLMKHFKTVSFPLPPQIPIGF